MARFECELPFKLGETWCRRNFFSADMKPIGEHARVIALSTPGLPPIIESAATRKTVPNENWGGTTEVIEVYLRLASGVETAGKAVATIEAAVDGALLPCGAVSDSPCDSGSSG